MRWQKIHCGDHLYKGFDDMIKDGSLNETIDKFLAEQKEKIELELGVSNLDSGSSEAGPETLSFKTGNTGVGKHARFVNPQKLNQRIMIEQLNKN